MVLMVFCHTRIRRKARTAIAKTTSVSIARIESSSGIKFVTESKRPALNKSVVYVRGFIRLTVCIAAGALLAG